jgi:predicted nucleotidyltransferase
MGIIKKALKQSNHSNRRIVKSALQDAMELARILVKKFGARAVVLYGSLAQGRYFDQTSDIDLAVKGIGDNYFRAYGYCIRLSKFDIDVRAYDDMPRSMKSRIDKEGRLIYGR